MATVGSILAVDFGNVHTRAVLIDLVEGVYTPVGQAIEPTTAGFPNHDVSAGLARVARQIGARTGRQMVGPDGRLIIPEQPNRSGVDAFIATASIGRPLRTVIIGLMPDLSVASALRAATGTYIDILDIITLEDARSSEETLNQIVLARPDLIFIVGGTEGGAAEPVLELARTVRLAARIMRGHAPQVLYAGNSVLRDQISALFGDAADVYFTDNVRPSIEVERLEGAQLELTLAFNTFSAQRGMGFDSVARMTQLGVLPNAQSYHLVSEYLGRLAARGRGVMVADIGAATSTLSAFVNGRASTSIRTDIGLGTSARALLDVVGTQAVADWLPFVSYEDEIRDYAMNKTLRPSLVPESLRALYLEHALLRAALGGLLNTARPAWTPDVIVDETHAPLPPFERIIGAGAALTNTGRPGMAAMLLLDALQPRGATRLQLDSAALIPSLGALSRLNPEAAVQLLEGSGIETLCTAISLTGTPRVGKSAAKVSIKLEMGSVETHIVAGGALWVYDLSPGAKAEVTVKAGRGLTIGGKRGLKMTVTGGTAGLVIDARGGPLPLGSGARAVANQLSNWYAQATGDPIREVAVGWLEDMMADNIAGVQRADESVSKKKGKKAKSIAGKAPIVDTSELPEVPVIEGAPPRSSSKGVRSIKSTKPTDAGAPARPQEELSDDDLRNLLS